MLKNIYFDYSAFVILAVLLGSVIYKNLVRGKTNRVYLLLVASSLLTTMFDIWAVTLDNNGSGYVFLKYLSHTMYLFLHAMAVPLYIIYFLVMTDMFDLFLRKRIKVTLLLLPEVSIIVALLINLFEHRLFYLDEAEAYTRGEWFLLLYIVTAFYMVYECYLIIRYRKLLEIDRLSSFVVGIMVMMIAVVIQYFCPTLLLEMFASAIGLLFIFMMVQRTEENVDTGTGYNKFKTYVDDMKRAFINHKQNTIIMVNVTNFESMRDMLGYDEIQLFKKEVAQQMAQRLFEEKVNAEFYYLGNGNFRIRISRKYEDKVETIAERLNSFLKDDVSWNDMKINMVACVCIVHCPEDIGDIESLNAFGYDLGAKHYSGNVLYASKIYKKQYYDIMRDIDTIIESALLNHKFEMYYQPIYSVAEKRFRSAEALIRLKDEKYGFISPEIFIPAAEKSGAIHKIGDFVLEEVCSFIASREFEKLGLEYVEINLSVAQCMHKQFKEHVLDILKKYGVNNGQVNLEITETAAGIDQTIMLENINALYREGLAFSLDDFGTGYSNMLRIASIPFKLIKLDKIFTRFEDNPNLLIVIENTIKMIKSMNMKIVIEGVETKEILDRFTELGCDYVQGYYFSKPVARADFIAFFNAKQMPVS